MKLVFTSGGRLLTSQKMNKHIKYITKSQMNWKEDARDGKQERKKEEIQGISSINLFWQCKIFSRQDGWTPRTQQEY